MTKIAFIGLGNMGSGMAANLARAGHTVHAFDLSEAALARAETHGIARAPSATAAAHRCRRDHHHAPRRHPRPRGLRRRSFRRRPPGRRPDRLLHHRCRHRASRSAKPPPHAACSRSTRPSQAAPPPRTRARSPSWSAAPKPAFARAQPILGAMGKAVIHAGGAGAGQAAKICNNMILARHDDRHLRSLRARRASSASKTRPSSISRPKPAASRGASPPTAPSPAPSPPHPPTAITRAASPRR